MQQWLPALAGYFVAIALGHFCVSPVVATLWSKVHPKRVAATPEVCRRTAPLLVGLIERPLYVVALTSGHAVIIGVWLAMKVAGRWGAWSRDDKTDDGQTIPGRCLYNIFLIGNGLSLIAAIAGWRVIHHSKSGDWASAAVVAGAFVIGAFATYVIARRSRETEGR